MDKELYISNEYNQTIYVLSMIIFGSKTIYKYLDVSSSKFHSLLGVMTENKNLIVF